jgi:hypothetical protein
VDDVGILLQAKPEQAADPDHLEILGQNFGSRAIELLRPGVSA